MRRAFLQVNPVFLHAKRISCKQAAILARTRLHGRKEVVSGQVGPASGMAFLEQGRRGREARGEQPATRVPVLRHVVILLCRALGFALLGIC